MSLLRNALFAGGTVSGLVYWAKQNFQKTTPEDKKNIGDQKDELKKRMLDNITAAFDQKQAEKSINSVVIKIMKNDPVATKLKELMNATLGHCNTNKNPITSVFHHNIFHYENPEITPKFEYMAGVDSLIYFEKEVRDGKFVKCLFQTQKSPFNEDYECLIMNTTDSAKCNELKDILQKSNAFADEIKFERMRREYKTR